MNHNKIGFGFHVADARTLDEDNISVEYREPRDEDTTDAISEMESSVYHGIREDVDGTLKLTDSESHEHEEDGQLDRIEPESDEIEACHFAKLLHILASRGIKPGSTEFMTITGLFLRAGGKNQFNSPKGQEDVLN